MAEVSQGNMANIPLDRQKVMSGRYGMRQTVTQVPRVLRFFLIDIAIKKWSEIGSGVQKYHHEVFRKNLNDRQRQMRLAWEAKRQANYGRLDRTMIFLLGVTPQGQTVTVYLPKFPLFIYIEIPATRYVTDPSSRQVLEQALRKRLFIQDRQDIFFSLTPERRRYWTRYDYDPQTLKPREHHVLKMACSSEAALKFASWKLPEEGLWLEGQHHKIQVFEHHVEPEHKTLDWMQVEPSSWVDVLRWDLPQRYFTHAQIEVQAPWEMIKQVKFDSESEEPPPPFILNFWDIETSSIHPRDNDMPEPTRSGHRIISLTNHYVDPHLRQLSTSYYVGAVNPPDEKWHAFDMNTFSETLLNEDLNLKFDQLEGTENPIHFLRDPLERDCRGSRLPQMSMIPDPEDARQLIFRFSPRMRLRMLEEWMDELRIDVQIQMMKSYNGYKFDIPWVHQYARHLLKLRRETFLAGQTAPPIDDPFLDWETCDPTIDGDGTDSRLFYLGMFFGERHEELFSKSLDNDQMGQNDVAAFQAPGWVQFDLIPNFVRTMLRANVHSLKAVCKDQFPDLPMIQKKEYEILEMFEDYRSGDPERAKRIVVYNKFDCVCTMALCFRYSLAAFTCSMSRTTITLMQNGLWTGLQNKVTHMVIWYAHKYGYLIDKTTTKIERRDRSNPKTIKRHHPGTPGNEDDEEEEQVDSFTGGLLPRTHYGWVFNHLTLLVDFNSLYPSVQEDNNLDPAMSVAERKKQDHLISVSQPKFVHTPETAIPYLLSLPPDSPSFAIPDDCKVKMGRCYQGPGGLEFLVFDMETSSRRHLFVISEQGVLPRILKLLKFSRRQVNDIMNGLDAKDPLRVILNIKQTILKLKANATFGYTGALEKGQYPCLPIAETITFVARNMLRCAMNVTEKCSSIYLRNLTPEERALLKSVDVRVLYGDTDSMMIEFLGLGTSEEEIVLLHKLSADLTQLISDLFGPAVQIKTEGVLKNFLLLKKKCYCALWQEKAGQDWKMMVKGLESKRRGFWPALQRTIRDIVDLLMKKNDAIAAYAVMEKLLTDLRDDKLPLEDYAVTKSRKRSYEKSKSLPAQAVVAEKQEKRCRGSSDSRPVYFFATPTDKQPIDWLRMVTKDLKKIKAKITPFAECYHYARRQHELWQAFQAKPELEGTPEYRQAHSGWWETRPFRMWYVLSAMRPLRIIMEQVVFDLKTKTENHNSEIQRLRPVEKLFTDFLHTIFDQTISQCSLPKVTVSPGGHQGDPLKQFGSAFHGMNACLKINAPPSRDLTGIQSGTRRYRTLNSAIQKLPVNKNSRQPEKQPPVPSKPSSSSSSSPSTSRDVAFLEFGVGGAPDPKSFSVHSEKQKKKQPDPLSAQLSKNDVEKNEDQHQEEEMDWEAHQLEMIQQARRRTMPQVPLLAQERKEKEAKKKSRQCTSLLNYIPSQDHK